MNSRRASLGGATRGGGFHPLPGRAGWWVALFAVGLTSTASAAGSLRFSFGTEPPPPGFVAVSAAAGDRSAAHGSLEPGAKVVAHARGVTGAEPFFFTVRLPEGNYTLRLTLGDDTGESVTTVKAEARRLMIEQLRTAAGQVAVREITVNIRTPRIGDPGAVKLKQREKDTEQVTWDEALTLEFNGVRPSLRTLEITPAPAAPTLFLAGDSTVADQPAEPWNSWGQMLPRFFGPGLAVANYAQSGESIKSSLGAGRFDKLFTVMKPGDTLLLQFGHNDMKDRAPDALATYRANLKDLVARTRARGGTPVLVTSMERKAGVQKPTLAAYPETVRDVAREDQVALIDLNALSLQLYRALGADLDRAFQDGSHHNNYGSYQLARCVAVGLARTGLPAADFLLEEARIFDPAHPDPVAEFQVPPSPTRAAATPDGS